MSEWGFIVVKSKITGRSSLRRCKEVSGLFRSKSEMSEKSKVKSEITIDAPRIEIKGLPGSGVSSLAWMIKDALSRQGIECEIGGAEDDYPRAMERSWKERITRLRGKSVTIETHRIPFLVA